MSKKNLPNIPIYIGDWERDCNILTLESEMAWMKIIFKMHLRGNLNVFKATRNGILNLWKKNSYEECETIINELKTNNICRIDFDPIFIIFNKINISNRATSLYTIELKNKHESFIKIGITANVKWIIRRYKSCGFNEVNIIKLEHFTDRREALIQEKIRHRNFFKFKYKPINDFPGKTECFTNDIKTIING